ncbi:PhzF family phenazine biosynthesis protein (plasmid) [Embleya sp. NBC_00888]|uniref:PhzF family phenazine biosynthesis protein n=1 Tax=Embleya sp. NBC_00888 TaxID=2975960 RepID=UPI002F913E0E|nr:PhzF family phenazine biosynthesis protein [Embleya sp. NBC_00888]
MYRYTVADVFTSTPLQGNPVAVFTDASEISEQRMQRIARELNLSETTFVLPPRGDADVRVRIFTPVNELPFAGHPTLGTAFVLGAEMKGNILRMETAAGLIPFAFERNGDRIVRATMRQPIPTWKQYEKQMILMSALGVESPSLPVVAYRNGPRHVYVGLGSVTELEAVQPDLRALATLPDMAAICFADADTHWRMRMFSPAYGVAEDAATGSAAGPLAIHLIRHGRLCYGERVEIRQGVEMGRLSTMYATVHGDGDTVSSVEVSGAAVVIARGELLL